MPYVVQILNKTAEIELIGETVELPLSCTNGMIGCMPVFETREQAEAFADGAYDVIELWCF